MADIVGQADIRGINIQKAIRGFADEEYIMKKHVLSTTTDAEEIRWFQKTSGALSSTDTTGMTADRLALAASGALPEVIGASFTRNTSYVKLFKAETEWIRQEDIDGSSLSILSIHLRDVARAIANQVDKRIYNIITENQSPSAILSTASTQTGWDDATNGNPVLDILNGEQKIRAQGYNGKEAIIVMNSIEHKHLLNYLIVTKGASFPNFSSEKMRDGAVMNILGHDVFVSENAPTDSVAMWIPGRSATWVSFSELKAVVIEDPLIGKKVRAAEWGECILHDPKSVHLITDTIT